MKAIALAGCLSLLAGTALAGDWRLVSYDSDAAYALNIEGLIPAGPKKTGWVALVQRTRTAGTDYILVRFEWDCVAATRTGLAFVGYADGEVTESNQTQTPAESIVPDTFDYDLFRAACFGEFRIPDDNGWPSVRLLMDDYRSAQEEGS